MSEERKDAISIGIRFMHVLYHYWLYVVGKLVEIF